MNSRRHFFKQTLTLGALACCAQISMAMPEKTRSLIVYYSRTLNTHILAKYLQELSNADMMRLETVQAYPNDFESVLKIAEQEREGNFRPELVNARINLDDYDMIFLGSPIWVGGISSPIRSFLSAYDFKNKIIAPFCTKVEDHSESYIADIQKFAPNANILKGIDIDADFEKNYENLAERNRKFLAGDASFLTFANKQEIKLWLNKI